MMPNAMRVSPFGHERRNDRVQRPLARREHVRMRAIEREQRAAILQRKSGAFGDDARPEAREVALDERHHVAVAIDDGQIRRVAAALATGSSARRRRAPARCRGSISAARSRA